MEAQRNQPLDHSDKTTPISQPISLATARVIRDITAIEYPEGIKSPQLELNINARQGRFRYDPPFLLQFMAVCKEKPDSLPPLDAIGIEPSDQHFAPMSCGGSGRHQPSISGIPPPSSTARSQGGAVGLGISGFNKQPSFSMSQFATPKSSEERFAMANRSSSMSGGPAGMPFGRPSPIVRYSSQGGPGGVPMGSNRTRTRSKRGETRNNNASSQPSAFGNNNAQLPPEPVAPLEVSADRWQPHSHCFKPAAVDEVVERKVKALLNKLTVEKFDSISDQIIAWANKSEKEKDGRILIQVTTLIFDSAAYEEPWAEMYASMCRKMMEQISPKVQDDGIRNVEGKHITGGHLFRKCLLNRCQEVFERGWASKESTAGTEADEDAAAKKAADSKESEITLYSDEYYAARKARRRGLGLIKFLGELFKLQMLTEGIIHECVKKLLGNAECPKEGEIESLCKLLTTVGARYDTPKARAHIDVYFSRMGELRKSPIVKPRIRFMLQDVIELRERKWVARNQSEATGDGQEASAEKGRFQGIRYVARGGSLFATDIGNKHRDGRGVPVSLSLQPRSKRGDLSNFGKISKAAPMTFGPSSVFASKKGGESTRDSAISRSGSVDMFSMLSQNPELANEVPVISKGCRPPSRKVSIDMGSGGAPDASGAPPQRRKLKLLPRWVPKEEERSEDTPGASTVGSEDEGESGGAMSETEAKTRIEEDSKEFFSIRDLEEAEVYFTKVPVEHRHLLVDKLVSSALESKEADAELVANYFARAASKNLCSPATFEQGFAETAEFLDDIAVDSPRAPQHFIKMLKGSGLDKDKERCKQLLSKSIDSEMLRGMLA